MALRPLRRLTSGNWRPRRPAAPEVTANAVLFVPSAGTRHVRRCRSVITQRGKETMGSEHENVLTQSRRVAATARDMQIRMTCLPASFVGMRLDVRSCRCADGSSGVWR